MRILDRYTGFFFIKNFSLSTVIFVVMYITIDFFTRLWRYDADLSSFAIYYALKTPEILYQMMPISALLGTLITFGVLSRTKELIAIQSAGISLFRTSLPLLVTSVLIAIFTFAIGDRVMPESSQSAQTVFLTKIQGREAAHSQRSVDVWYRSKGVVYNIKTVLPAENRIEGITIYYVDESFTPKEIISAFSGKYQGNAWVLKNGKVVQFQSNDLPPIIRTFDSQTVQLRETPTDLANIERQTEVMSSHSLKRFIAQNREAGFSTHRQETVLYERYSFSFACVILVFLAIPFGIQRGKHGGFARDVGLCLVVAFIYWVSLSTLVSFGYKGSLPPFIAAWGANAVFLIIGYYYLRKTSFS